jgi:hypothetical protein
MLTSCKATGINDWTFEDNVLSWEAVDGARYYELILYDDEDNEITTIDPLFVYGTSFDFASLFRAESEFDLIIKAFLEDGTTKESNRIQFILEIPYPHPVSIGKNYLSTRIEWQQAMGENLIDYTVRVNGVDQNVGTNYLEITDLYDDGIYQVQVRANYQGGSSAWTEPYWYSVQQDLESIYVFFEPTENQNVRYTFDNDIVAVTGYYLLSSNRVLPELIAEINGAELTLNRFYVFNPNVDTLSENMLFGIVTVYTEDAVYPLYITNNEALVD